MWARSCVIGIYIDGCRSRTRRCKSASAVRELALVSQVTPTNGPVPALAAFTALCPGNNQICHVPSHKNVPCALEPVFPFPNFALLCQHQRTLTIPPLPQWCPRSGPAQICAVCQNLAQMPDALFCPSFGRSDTGSWTIEVAKLFLDVQISTKSLGYSTISVTTQQFPGV